MSILFSLVKDLFRKKPASSGDKEISSLSPVLGSRNKSGSESNLYSIDSNDKFAAYSIDNDPDITNISSRKLHIGGREKKLGWKLLNIQPGDGVDYVGDINDLSQFPDGSFDVIYGSHVLEHIPQGNMVHTLSGLHRILGPNGKLMISVPDLEVLCRLFVDPSLDKAARFHIMRMMFGGQTDPFDYHYIGLSYEILLEYLQAANFKFVNRVNGFGIFNDTSSYSPYQVPFSLNVIAFKTPAP